MRLRWLGALVLIAFWLPTPSEGQIVKAGGGYRLRAKYAKGKSFRYQIQTTVSQLGDRAGVTRRAVLLPVLMKVLDVRGGVAKIQNKIGPWTEAGKTIQSASTMVVHVDSRNQLVDGPKVEVPSFNVQFPEKPLKIGQGWTAEVNTSGATPVALKVKATYTLQKVSGGTAVLGVAYSGQGVAPSQARTSGRGTLVLSVADGSLKSMQVTQTVLISSTVGATSVVTVKRTA